jgi:hypothetical protein
MASSDKGVPVSPDPRNSLFVGEREVKYINDINTELFELVTLQKVVYYAIEKDLTPTHQLYGESAEKRFRQPIEVYCRVQWNEPQVVTNQFSTETLYSLDVFMQKRRVIELNFTPRIGDFLEFDKKFFEVTTLTEPQLIAGLPEFKMGFNLSCTIAREQVFQPNKTDTWSNNNSGIGV